MHGYESDREHAGALDDNEIIRPRHAADVFEQPAAREHMHAIPPPAQRLERLEGMLIAGHLTPEQADELRGLDCTCPREPILQDDTGHELDQPCPARPVSVEDVTRAEHRRRKERPLARGVLDYFPDALLEVANVSRVGNEQHNPGQPLHWAYGESMDHADCVSRHLLDRGTLDTDGLAHSAKVAWRALALLQTELEKADPELHARRQAQRERAAKGT